MIDNPIEEFRINKKKYAKSEMTKCKRCKGTGEAKIYRCLSCRKFHQFSHNYVLCKIQKEFDKKLKNKPLPYWTKYGTRKDWVENYGYIARWNWSILQFDILVRDNKTCQKCGANDNGKDDVRLEVHHIIPRAEGGSDHPINLQTLCKKCHRDETNHFLGNKSAYKIGQKKLGGKHEN